MVAPFHAGVHPETSGIFCLGPGLGPEEVLRRHGNETFYADDTRGNYAHPKLGDYVQERCQGLWRGLDMGWTWIWTWIEHGFFHPKWKLLKWKMRVNIDKLKSRWTSECPLPSDSCSQARDVCHG